MLYEKKQSKEKQKKKFYALEVNTSSMTGTAKKLEKVIEKLLARSSLNQT
jgi:hypothetical protein